jgi:hypothetical protein
MMNFKVSMVIGLKNLRGQNSAGASLRCAAFPTILQTLAADPKPGFSKKARTRDRFARTELGPFSNFSAASHLVAGLTPPRVMPPSANAT